MSNENPELLIGPYTEEIRAHYIAYKKGRYLIDHPGATEGQASRNARIGWRNKVKKALQRKEASHELQK